MVGVMLCDPLRPGLVATAGAKQSGKASSLEGERGIRRRGSEGVGRGGGGEGWGRGRGGGRKKNMRCRGRRRGWRGGAGVGWG